MTENEEMTAEELAALKAEQARLEAEERARIEHENYLNSFPETTVFFDQIIINGDVQHLGAYVMDAHTAERYGWLENHRDMSELTAVGTILYIKGHEKPEESREEKIERISAEVVTGIQELLDFTAHSKGYDSGEMLATYATDPDPEFGAQGRAYVAWRGRCWRKCYDILDQVIAGELEPEDVTVSFVLGALPPLEW